MSEWWENTEKCGNLYYLQFNYSFCYKYCAIKTIFNCKAKKKKKKNGEKEKKADLSFAVV